MVHAIAHTTRVHASRPHPDAKRIAGMTGAITFNLALLMLLIAPISTPLPKPENEIFRFVDLTPKVVPPTKPPPIKVPVTKPQPTLTKPTITKRIEVPTQPSEQIIDPQGTEQAQPPEQTQIAKVEQVDTRPIPGVRLEYASAPAPAYPRDALREGIQGTVMLQVLVDVDGRPLQVDIQHSSGNRQLDNAARRQVLEHWLFRPAMKDGRPVQAIGLVPIAFNLG